MDTSGLTETLATLEPGMALFVPDELLAQWFQPGARDGHFEAAVLDAIQRLASETSCVFEYVTSKGAGRFTKLARC